MVVIWSWRYDELRFLEPFPYFTYKGSPFRQTNHQDTNFQQFTPNYTKSQLSKPKPKHQRKKHLRPQQQIQQRSWPPTRLQPRSLPPPRPRSNPSIITWNHSTPTISRKPRLPNKTTNTPRDNNWTQWVVSRYLRHF